MDPHKIVNVFMIFIVASIAYGSGTAANLFDLSDKIENILPYLTISDQQIMEIKNPLFKPIHLTDRYIYTKNTKNTIKTVNATADKNFDDMINIEKNRSSY